MAEEIIIGKDFSERCRIAEKYLDKELKKLLARKDFADLNSKKLNKLIDVVREGYLDHFPNEKWRADDWMRVTGCLDAYHYGTAAKETLEKPYEERLKIASEAYERIFRASYNYFNGNGMRQRLENEAEKAFSMYFNIKEESRCVADCEKVKERFRAKQKEIERKAKEAEREKFLSRPYEERFEEAGKKFRARFQDILNSSEDPNFGGAKLDFLNQFSKEEQSKARLDLEKLEKSCYNIDKIKNIRQTLKGITEMNEAKRANLKTNVRKRGIEVELDSKEISGSWFGTGIGAGVGGAGLGFLLGGPLGAIVGSVAGNLGTLFTSVAMGDDGGGGWRLGFSRSRALKKGLSNKKIKAKRKADLKLAKIYRKDREKFKENPELATQAKNITHRSIGRA